MWKVPAVPVLLVVSVLAVGGWLAVAAADDAPATDNGANTQQPGEAQPAGPVNDQAADNDIPRQAAKEFAPWLEAVIEEKSDVAGRTFPLSHAAQDVIDGQNALRIFRKFPKLNGVNLSLIGGRSLGDQTGILLFTITTDTGPVAFKIYHYRFGNTRTVGKIEISDDWTEIERMYTTVDALPAPVVVPL